MSHRRAFVLLTAIPPTKGHAALIEYARWIADEVVVILNTQPDEPFVKERVSSLQKFIWNLNEKNPYSQARLYHYDKPMQQEPKDDKDWAFWQLWLTILEGAGAQKGDAIVASERYGAETANLIEGVFYPFDMDRVIVPAKATTVRSDPITNISSVLPEFQEHIRKTVTIFGSDSVGKTSLARALDEHYLPEWARPYLETPEIGSDITKEKMHAIWQGQLALQRYGKWGESSIDKAVIVQDTDLFTTLGYWQLNGWTVPFDLASNAIDNKSDLYIIPQSNIPFEPDPLRYGGDKRETTDSFWVDIANGYKLNYIVLNDADFESRIDQSKGAIIDLFSEVVATLRYKREGKEYS